MKKIKLSAADLQAQLPLDLDVAPPAGPLAARAVRVWPPRTGAAGPGQAQAQRQQVAAEEEPGCTVEQAAARLEAHPDFRVLRRLTPCLDFGPAPEGAQTLQLLVLDTETTGLEPGSARLIELALLRVAVDVRTGRPCGPVQVYDGLEAPGFALPPEVVRLTGITDEMLAGQRLDEARVAELLQGVDLVVAHNAGFDRPFVEARFAAAAELPWACSWADVDWKALGQGSAKLEHLALALGWFYDAHRAETDCHALLAVLAQPLARWREVAARALPPPALQAQQAGAVAGVEGAGGEAPPATLLAQLWQAAQRPQFRLQATGAPFEAKELLKARQYRWDAQQRVWGTTVRGAEALEAELQWLQQQVFACRATPVRVETVDARLRYSTRSGAARLHMLGSPWAEASGDEAAALSAAMPPG